MTYIISKKRKPSIFVKKMAILFKEILYLFDSEYNKYIYDYLADNKMILNIYEIYFINNKICFDSNKYFLSIKLYLFLFYETRAKAV